MLKQLLHQIATYREAKLNKRLQAEVGFCESCGQVCNATCRIEGNFARLEQQRHQYYARF